MRKAFITGLIILLPVALTLMIIFFLFDFFTGPFVPIVSALLSQIEAKLHFTLPPGLDLFISRLFALILLSIFILLLGAAARWFLIRKFLHGTHLLISRIPLIKSVYKVSREVFHALFSGEGKKAFKDPVIFPFPSPPAYAVGFHVGEVAQECQEKVDTPLISVFMPTAPHPISGFLFLVPERDVRKIEMMNEEVFKFLVSCGMIHPPGEKVEIDEIL